METSVPPPSAAPQSDKKQEQDRTLGLKLFDVLLYPILTNFVVFGISVGATYLTSRGGDRDAAGKLVYGKFGKWFQTRGDWMVGKFKSLGLSHEQADMSKMVFFSFADGSLMAPFIKLLEDKRENIGRWLDDRLGTTPTDPGVYEAEPKHSWLSVLGGRFITAGIVVPTAVALDKTGLNDKFFIEPGKKIGEWLAKKPRVTKFFSPFGIKLDIKELSKVSLFEFFYTSVCTAGLYFTSRRIAHFRHQSTGKSTPKEGTGCPATPSHHPTENTTSEAIITDTAMPTATREDLRKSRPSTPSLTNYADKYNAEPAQTLALGA